ncbi:MAG: RagB/SusD family nutrient uptake outer membrane protein [Balneolaceae bacterium]|nr:RagB/SusD family nutrient uptake outer membrane protein [Balneolaceae bacterium]
MKTIKRIIGTVGTALVVLLTFYACDVDSFLDVNPQGSLSANVLANQDGVEANLIAAYSMLDGYGDYGGWGTAASNWTFGSVTTDNAYKGSEPGDQQPITDIEFFQWNTSGTDGYLNDKWTVNYDGINRANATIKLLNQVQESSGEISDSDANSIRGEATFLRAHYHFEAWKMWKNIPYYTEEDTDFRKPNTGTDPIANILADLDQAISLLPATQGDVGRVTQWTARAYKGRVQAYTGDWQGALTTLREVEQSGPYALEEDYRQVFSVLNENGPETILAYQASTNDGDNDGDNGNYPDRLNFPHAGSPFGCCGFHQPSQNLVNAFRVNSEGLPMPLTDPNTWNDNDDNFAAGDMTPVDPRLDWTVGRDGVPYLDYAIHEPGWIRDRAWAGPYSPKKNVYEQSSGVGSSVGWAGYQLNAQNLHLYRYADLLLLLAEAEVQAGSLDNARQIVNRIRTRAAQVAQGPVGNPRVPIDDPSITWANYEIGTYPAGSPHFADKASALRAVQMERRLELAMEGHRYFDLRRWGIAQETINQYLEVEQTRREYLTGADQYSDRNELYPLPTVQIELSTVNGEQRLVQNPGW